MKRFFGRIENAHMLIEGDELFHLTKVLRMKVSDEITVCCNDEHDYTCTLVQINKNYAVAEIKEKALCKALPKRNIVLFQALPKKEYFDNIIAKSIELGVNKIVPFSSQFTVSRELKKERIQTQVITACKQCERSKLIEVSDVVTFSDMLKSLQSFDAIIFANEDDNETTKFAPEMVKNKQNIAVIVGAEAGFSSAERNQIIAVGATSITLGSRILRNDTAAIAMLTLVGIMSDN